jgi:hypothetical protein
LREQHGVENVIAADQHSHNPGTGHYVELNVLEHAMLEKVVKEYGVTQIYLLAAMLSATGEKNSDVAWKLIEKL